MKKVKLISYGFSILISFAANAQEKAVSKEHSEKKALETSIKTKDTILETKVTMNIIKPAASPTRIIISAPSKSSIINEPLYVLDGVLINSKQFSKVNPNDIESIKILKGIEATSLYGSQGVNGVVIITTKDKD